MDFVNDQMLDGRTFRILAVIDQWSRECVPGSQLQAVRTLQCCVNRIGQRNNHVRKLHNVLLGGWRGCASANRLSMSDSSRVPREVGSANPGGSVSQTIREKCTKRTDRMRPIPP